MLFGDFRSGEVQVIFEKEMYESFEKVFHIIYRIRLPNLDSMYLLGYISHDTIKCIEQNYIEIA